MPAIFDWAHEVNERDLDDLGHANNISYIKWMQSAALAHSAVQGWPVEAYRQIGHGWVVRSHRIEYLAPARLGDRIIVRTFVANLKKVTSLRKFRMIRLTDDVILAKAETDWVFVEYATGTVKRIMPSVSGAFDVVPDLD